MSSWSFWRAANLQSIKCGPPETPYKLIRIILRKIKKETGLELGERRERETEIEQRKREGELELCLMSWAKIWSNRETQGIYKCQTMEGGWKSRERKIPLGPLQSRIHNYNRKCFSLISSALQASDKQKKIFKYKRNRPETKICC